VVGGITEVAVSEVGGIAEATASEVGGSKIAIAPEVGGIKITTAPEVGNCYRERSESCCGAGSYFLYTGMPEKP
jgi:hypothetical protein